MEPSRPRRLLLAGLAGLILLAPQPALAYVGPGLGLGALGAIAGVLLSILLAIVALVWFPLKRLLGGRKKVQAATSPQQDLQESGKSGT